MIVRYTNRGWEIITQRGHGLLAAEICARWKISDQPKRWVETLIACAGHDDAFNEFEYGPLITSAGGPINFNMNLFDEKLSQKLIDMAATKSSWIALLTAQHIKFTHGSEPKAKRFLMQLKKEERRWLKSAETDSDEVESAYQLLEFCDAFSLIICQATLQPESRSMEISNGPDGTIYQVISEGENLIVKPWPFETDEFPVSYEVRLLKRLVFKDDADFEKSLRLAESVRVTLKVKKPDGP